AVEIDHAGQVGALVPELRAVADLLKQVGDQGSSIDALARRGNAKLRFGQVPGQHPGVVPIALDRTRVARDAVLLETRSALGDGAGEEDAGYGGAFPEGRLGGEPALAEGCHAQRGEVAKRRDEASRGD